MTSCVVVFRFAQFVMLRTKTNVCSTYALQHSQGFNLRDPYISLNFSRVKLQTLSFILKGTN